MKQYRYEWKGKIINQWKLLYKKEVSMCSKRWWGNINPISPVFLRTVESSQYSGCSHMIPVSFEAFPKEVQGLNFSAVHFQPWNVSLWPRISLIEQEFCPRGLCPAQPLNLRLQQGHNKHTTCSEQAVSKKYQIFYLGTVSACVLAYLCPFNPHKIRPLAERGATKEWIIQKKSFF